MEDDEGGRERGRREGRGGGALASARAPLALALALALAPLATAGIPPEADIADASGDVRTPEGTVADYPSIDILRVTSTLVNDTTVIQRVQMASRPVAPDDSIVLRSWYDDSENGSFHVIDMEVRGNEPDTAQRFKPVRREGSFDNVTYLGETRYGLDNATWVFEFPASLLADATCFDVGAFSQHSPPQRTRQPMGFDSAYTRERACVTAEEPAPEVPLAPVRVGVPTPAAASAPAPPGSVTPTPLGAWVPLGALLMALLVRHKARRITGSSDQRNDDPRIR